MARSPLIAVAILCAGCSAAARLGVTARSTAAAGSPDEVASSAGAPAPASAPDEPPRFAETTLQQQLLALRGLTVDEAREQLRRIGQDGPVKVLRIYKHVSSCAPERVCEVVRSRAGDPHGEIQLWLNPKLELAVPEP